MVGFFNARKENKRLPGTIVSGMKYFFIGLDEHGLIDGLSIVIYHHDVYPDSQF